MTEAAPGATPDFDQDPELDRAVEARLRPEIVPRSTWGEQLPPTGPLTPEDDVRFLLVHHTASGNGYKSGDVVDQIVDFYKFHTGPERGWPDLAYNFLIDRFGTIWEARQGSIAEPIRGDATGGSQGFALLASLIGNHAEAPATPEALNSLTRLLAWLGHRYRIDTAPGATVTFSSRGSNRWPAGTDVTAHSISGHRDMSLTTCPGDWVYELLGRSLPEQVQSLRQVALDQAMAELEADASTTTSEAEPEAAPEDPTAPSPATIGSESVEVPADKTTADKTTADHTTANEPTATDPTEEVALGEDTAENDDDLYLISAGATMVVGGLAALIALRRRRIGRRLR